MLRCTTACNSLRVFNHERILNFVRCLFLHLLSCNFFVFHPINPVYQIYWSSFVKAFLHSIDKSYLLMVNFSFSMLLHSVYQHLVKNFHICVHLRCWPIIVFFIVFLSGFGKGEMLASWSVFGNHLPFQFFGRVWKILVLLFL
jgi:hypothetical protein